MTETIEKYIHKEKTKIIFISLISGIIASYISILYFNPLKINSIFPIIPVIILEILFSNRTQDNPNKNGRTDAYTILMTIVFWFISYTILLY